ncbi:UNVERIFIED_CONTAM: hypothetical protein GTU68_033964 [Idotea baltica]|nr:hypothetical protein [Idotea baltica]
MAQHPVYEKIFPSLVNKPGVYRYFDKDDEILYIGKAKNLKRRVASYFTKTHHHGRLRVLVRKIARVEFTIVETEQDALLLENALIKKLQPRYNINLKDDKTYPYICIKNERFPRVFLTRRLVKDGSEYLGPFTSVSRVKLILDFVNRVFPLRTCNFNLSKKNIAAQKFKVCLEYHLGNCLGPCENKQSEEDYNENIKQVKHILKGKYGPVIAELKEEMQAFAAEYKFEEAEKSKHKLELIQNYRSKSTIVNPKMEDIEVYGYTQLENRSFVSYFKVTNGTIIQTKMLELKNKLDETQEDLLRAAIVEIRAAQKDPPKELLVPFEIEYPDSSLLLTIPKIGDKKKLLDLATKNVLYYKQQKMEQDRSKNHTKKQFEILQQIQSDFRLTELPRHIECFDNSNFQGTDPVASMVVFKDGKPANKMYRHYKIKTVVGSDDFASMTEVVYRRYKRLLKEEQPLPNLIIIDGGKGQLNAGLKALEDLNLRGRIPIAGIAKKLEEIFLPDDPIPLHISKKSISLKVIQHIRNEAHRFAITFHRNLRSKNTFQSELEQIKGIGKKSMEKLLLYFKGMENIKNAPLTELEKVLDRKKSVLVYNFFRP